MERQRHSDYDTGPNPYKPKPPPVKPRANPMPPPVEPRTPRRPPPLKPTPVQTTQSNGNRRSSTNRTTQPIPPKDPKPNQNFSVGWLWLLISSAIAIAGYKVVQKNKDVPVPVRESSKLIFCSSPLSATEDKYFSCTLTSEGLNNPTYFASGLPNGLSIESKTGRIDGYPKYFGNYKFNVWAQQGNLKTNVLGVYINIKKPTKKLRSIPPVTISPPKRISPPPKEYKVISEPIWQGRVGEIFSTSLTSDLNSPEYKIINNLPSGITLNKRTGVVSGVPQKEGRYEVSFYAWVGSKVTQAKTITFTVLPIEIVDLGIVNINGITNDFLLFPIEQPNLKFSKVELDLAPPGLSFNHKSQSIVGHPSKEGTYESKVKLYSLNGKIYSKKLYFVISKPSFKINAEILDISSSAVILLYGDSGLKGKLPSKTQNVSIWDEDERIHIGVSNVKWVKEKTLCIFPPKMAYRSPSFQKEKKVIITEAINGPKSIVGTADKSFNGEIESKYLIRGKSWSCYGPFPSNLRAGSRLLVSKNNSSIGHAEVKKTSNLSFEFEFLVKPTNLPPNRSLVTFVVLN